MAMNNGISTFQGFNNLIDVKMVRKASLLFFPSQRRKITGHGKFRGNPKLWDQKGKGCRSYFHDIPKIIVTGVFQKSTGADKAAYQIKFVIPKFSGFKFNIIWAMVNRHDTDRPKTRKRRAAQDAQHAT